MSSSANKRSLPEPDPAGHDAGAITPASLKAGAVEQATDLGGGYVIVKIGAAPVHGVREDVKVPVIPRRQLLRLIKGLMDEEASAPGRHGSGPAHGHENVDDGEDNAALLADMAAQAMARRRALHEQGLLLTSAQICDLLGITRQALSRAVGGRRMFAVDGPGGAQWYPAFYGASTANRRDLEKVAVALADLPGDAKWQFFTTPKHSLGGKTPVEALEGGALEQVLRTAAEVRERSLGR